MKDIDFDELDRAVSSVLGQKVPTKQSDLAAVTNAASKSTNDKVTVSSNTAGSLNDLATAEIESTSSPAVVETPPATEKTRSATPLAVKRRGRFMDVMHPSGSAPMPAVQTPVHTTKKLAPLDNSDSVIPLDSPSPNSELTFDAPEIITVSEPSEPIADLDESSGLIGAEPTVVETEAPSNLKNTAPEVHPGDHLLEASYEDTVDETVNTEDKGEDSETSLDTVDEPITTGFMDSVPQSTPFLADTKVDKRPLGGAVASSSAVAESTLGSQTVPDVPLPRELQPDVVQVESVQETELAPSGPGSKPFATNVEAAPDPQDDGRVEGHPLFDTSTYHEPISAVQDNSSFPVWAKWLLGLAGCLAIGAGVGYFLFTAGL